MLQTNNVWAILGRSSAWTTPYSDSSPPTTTQVGAISAPFLAIKCVLYPVYEVTPTVGTFAYNDPSTYVCTATIAGTITVGDQITLVFTSTVLNNSPKTLTYTVQSGDTLAAIALQLSILIDNDIDLEVFGINASVNGAVVEFTYPSTKILTVSGSSSSGSTETVTVSTPAVQVRYFNAYSTIADAIAAGCLLVLAACAVTGSTIPSGNTAWRQVGFASDVIPQTGHESDTVLIASTVAAWGDTEALTNQLPQPVFLTSNYNLRQIFGF